MLNINLWKPVARIIPINPGELIIREKHETPEETILDIPEMDDPQLLGIISKKRAKEKYSG